MTSIMASKMRVPSRISSTAFPDDASAAAMRQSPRAKRGPMVDDVGAGVVGVVIAVITGRLIATEVSYLGEARLAARALHPTDAADMLNIDLSGKRALVAGVADDAGYGFAIAKELVEAGASVVVGTWPPALNIFRHPPQPRKMDESPGPPSR